MDPTLIREALIQGCDPSEVASRVRDEVGEDPKALEGFLDALVKEPVPQLGPFLRELLGSVKEKKGQKAVRRALFKLRQRGVVMEIAPVGKSVLRPLRPPEPKGRLGAMDVRGRMFLVLERQGPRAVVGYVALGSLEEGLLDFFRVETTRRAWRQLLAGRVATDAFPLVDAPAAYCWHLIGELASSTEGLPPDYGRARQEMADLRWDGPVPIIYQFVSPEEVEGRGSLLRASEALFEVLPFAVWFLEAEEVRPWAEELRKAEESPLVLTDRQKAERREGILLKALEGLFPEERRLAMKRQLEEMAYLLWVRGERERAKTALAAALELERPLSPFAPHPFLRGLLLRSIARLQGEGEQRTSVLVTP